MARDLHDATPTGHLLREAERRHRDLVENLNDVVYTLSLDGRVTYVSPAIERVLGCRTEDVTDRHYTALAHPDDHDVLSRALHDAQAGRQQPIEFRFAVAPNEYRWVRSSGWPMVDDDHVVGLIGLLTNVHERRRAEEALRTSQSFLDSIIEHSPHALWVSDAAGTMIRMNQACRDLLHIADAEVVGKYNVLQDPIVARSGALPLVQRVYEAGETAKFEIDYDSELLKELPLAQRVHVVLEVTISPVRDASGSITNAVIQHLDVTTRRRVEDELRRSQENLSAALLLAHLGHWEYDVVRDVFTFNDQFYSLMRTTAEREGGYEMSSERYTRRFCHPDDAHLVALETQKALATSDPGYSAEIEHRVVFGDGQLGHVAVRIVVVKDAQGRTVRTYGVNQDVTARRRAFEAVRASEERFHAVFDAVTDGIALISTQAGRVEMANQAMCRLLRRTSIDLLGSAVETMHPPDAVAGVREILQHHPREPFLRSGVPMRRSDGSVFGADIHSLPFMLGDTKCILAVFRDMTDYNAMEQRLRQAQKMEAVGQLAGGVAHDFNNILGIILGHCELTLMKLQSSDPLAASLREIQSGAERAARLTRQLLAFSRKQMLAPEVLDLNATVREMEAMLRRLIGEHIEIATTLADDLGRVKADPTQVEQVIINLAVNARDAMPDGGRLVIETTNVQLSEQDARGHAGRVSGPYAMIAVRDSGCGMDAATCERIFEPFFTTKDTGQGTGLGLAIVYGIVQQSGGFVRVESEVGRGTTFFVCLPHTDERATPVAHHAPSHATRGNGERLLVVEDEPGLRAVARDALRDFGYRVTVAANGGEALLEVEERGLVPDLLITDIVMPGMSGVVLTQRLRRKHPELRVLFMSGYTGGNMAQVDSLDPGAPFIQKPFRIDDLMAKVAQTLRAD